MLAVPQQGDRDRQVPGSSSRPTSNAVSKTQGGHHLKTGSQADPAACTCPSLCLPVCLYLSVSLSPHTQKNDTQMSSHRVESSQACFPVNWTRACVLTTSAPDTRECPGHLFNCSTHGICTRCWVSKGSKGTVCSNNRVVGWEDRRALPAK